MKRKLALLLAAVMTVTALPGTVFAANNNEITRNVNAQAKTVFFEEGSITTPRTGEIKNNSNIEYYAVGPDLHIRFTGPTPAGRTINLKLEGAEWYFRSTATSHKRDSVAISFAMLPADLKASITDFTTARLIKNAAASGDPLTGNLTTVSAKEQEIKDYFVDELDYDATDVVIVSEASYGTEGDATFVPHNATADISIKYTSDTDTLTATGDGTLTQPGTISIQRNYPTLPDKLVGGGEITVDNGWPTSPFTTYNLNNGIGEWDGGTAQQSNTYTYYRDTKTNAHEKYYYLDITGDESQALITTREAADEGDWIVVPLVIRTTVDSDFNVAVTAGTAKVSDGVLRIGSSFDGRTNATTAVITARDTFKLDPIYLNELRPASIKNGAKFEIVAPSGYEFGNLGSPANLDNVGVYLQAPLTWKANGLAGKAPVTTTHSTTDTLTNGIYDMKFATRRNSEIDRSVIQFWLKDGAINETDAGKGGALFFKNLVLVSTDDGEVVNIDKELKISFRDTGTTRSITDQDLVVAKVADYTVTLTRVKDEIPTLISGRLNGPVYVTDGVYTDEIKDASHKAQTIKFAEKIADAWWSERTTKLSVPEEVTIMKAKFDKITKMTTTGENSKSDMLLGTNGTGNTGVYYNTRKKSSNGHIYIKDNVLTLNTLYVDPNAKATFELTLWLSIAATFEGEIALKLDGSAIRDVESNKDVSVVIAKAVTPVKISTKVSEVKIGYQYFSVADFDIIENIAGGFLQGEDAYVTITDGISVDMDIAKGFTATVSDGDLKIKDVNVGTVLKMYNSANTSAATGGQITFYIDRESTKPSTVSFKNVQVKVNRSVPYSNESKDLDRGIDIYVWGPAVAANYYYLGYSYTAAAGKAAVNSNDTFSNVAGISTKYINVVTLVDNKASDYANVVKVTIGNPIVKVNNEEFTIPVAAYVSTKSNSTMVPVRFVANALGLPEESVKWDAVNSTVTVDTGNNRIVQFQVGNTNYLVNGVSIPMVSPDGLAVACEVTEERAFVPFRALGEAFGINVGWDAATTTATYNAPIVK